MKVIHDYDDWFTGWTSRQQFEETWAGLLGVFTAPVIAEDIAPEVGVTISS